MAKKEHIINVPEWQGISIKTLEKFLKEAKERGDNVICFDVDWGYYRDVEGFDLRSEKQNQKYVDERRKENPNF